MTESNTPELLPCPFCAWPKVFVFDTKEAPFWVECPDCFAQGSPCDTKPEAIAAWNTRTAAASSSAAQIAELREALEIFRFDSDADVFRLIDRLSALLAKHQQEGGAA